MSRFKSGIDRFQLSLIPTYLDDLIDKNADVRVIDAFVDSLDLVELGFKNSSPSNKGQKVYNPADLLKLYLFGYKSGVRSSRKLMYQAKNNIEFIWLLHGLKPDFRTISDFRKNNKDVLKSILVQFNLDCNELNLISSIQSQDGTKVKAVNSKDNNFTASKLDDRRKHATEHVNQYLDLMDLNDELESKLQYMSESQKVKFMIDNLDSLISSDNFDKSKCLDDLDKIKSKLDFLDSIEDKMIKDGSTQVSLNDKDSRLMPNNGKFEVSYNNQVLVDTKSHIVTNFKLGNNPADLGSIHDISKETKDIFNMDTLTNITDKGYNSNDDMVNCLKDGIIPDVTPLKGKDTFTLETDYVKHNITDDMINSSNPDDIKACLESVIIPNIYKDNITSIEIKDVNVYEDVDEDTDLDLSDNEMRDLAMKDNCFVRNKKLNKVYCPMGEILRQKSTNSKGIRYCNKLACKNCKNPCCNSSYKTVDFSLNQTISYTRNSNTSNKKKSKKKKKTIKKIIFNFKPKQDNLKIRMQTSEHCHAQLKFWDNSRYLLLKGIDKGTAELSLYYCAYNIRRVINIIGPNELIKYFKEKKLKKELSIA